MDILNRINRLVKEGTEELQDEYDRLKKELQAAKDRKASSSTLDLIRSKMSALRLRIVKGKA